MFCYNEENNLRKQLTLVINQRSCDRRAMFCLIRSRVHLQDKLLVTRRIHFYTYQEVDLSVYMPCCQLSHQEQAGPSAQKPETHRGASAKQDVFTFLTLPFDVFDCAVFTESE